MVTVVRAQMASTQTAPLALTVLPVSMIRMTTRQQRV
jgi:hypothetical protein